MPIETPEKQFNELCQKAIEILKQTKVRRSKQALFDVFFGMWNNGYFDGYGEAGRVEDTFGFSQFFLAHGNADVASLTGRWYTDTYGKRKAPKTVKMVTCGVGELLRETERAYCFHGGKLTNKGRHGPEPTQIWVPKSQIEYNEQAGTVTMPVWLAQEKNYMRTA